MAKKLAPAPHRILRELTPEEKARQLKGRAEALAEKPAMMAIGRKHKKAAETRLAELRTVFTALKAEREAQGLSLADMSERTGLTREAISKLENLVRGNPTLETVERYATALGKHVVLQLVPASV